MIAVLRVVVAYLDLDTCERVIACVTPKEQAELWRFKFHYTYPRYANKILPISHYEALYRPRLFHNNEFVPLLVLYIASEIVVDILGDAYYIDDRIYPLPTISRFHTRVYLEHEELNDTIHLMYINDQQELRSVTIKDTEPDDILLQEQVQHAMYDLDLVVMHNRQVQTHPVNFVLTSANEESLYHYEAVIYALRHSLIPWTPLALPHDIISIAAFDYTLVFVTARGDVYAVHHNYQWNQIGEIADYLGEKQDYVFRYDRYALTIDSKCMKVVYPYHVYPLCGKSFEFDKVEYVQGLPMITYQGKIYSPIDFIKLCLDKPIRYHLQEMAVASGNER